MNFENATVSIHLPEIVPTEPEPAKEDHHCKNYMVAENRTIF